MGNGYDDNARTPPTIANRSVEQEVREKEHAAGRRRLLGEPLDRPHDGVLSSFPEGLQPRIDALNETIARMFPLIDEIEGNLVGATPRPGDTRDTPPAPGQDGLRWKIDLAITRATALVGQLEGIRRTFRPNDRIENAG